MTDLVEKCEKMDLRLQSNLLLTGSSPEGTKMWVPDEFDFMMGLTQLKGRCDLERNLGQNEITVRKECQLLWSDLLKARNCSQLFPQKIKNYIESLLRKAASSLERSRYPNILFYLCEYSLRKENFIKRTKVGVKLTFYWLGVKFKKLLVNVDLTPAIPLQLPEQCIS